MPEKSSRMQMGNLGKGQQISHVPDQETRDERQIAQDRLEFLKKRLLTLFVMIHRQQVDREQETVSLCLLQDELSEIIWILEDWRSQSGSRN